MFIRGCAGDPPRGREARRRGSTGLLLQHCGSRGLCRSPKELWILVGPPQLNCTGTRELYGAPLEGGVTVGEAVFFS